jgi:uncharacterized protein (TIGR03437 family)
VTPDSLASLFGANLAGDVVQAQLDTSGNLPVELDGVSVEVNGKKAGLLFVSPGQINLWIPPETVTGDAQVVVMRSTGTAIGAGTANVQRTAPALFALDATGHGPGAILNGVTNNLGPFTVQTPENGGDDKRTRLSLFGTGLRLAGDPASPPTGGNVASYVSALSLTNGGESLDLAVEYAGPAPGFFGLDQINVVLPKELDGAGTVTITVSVGDQISNGVTVQIWSLTPPSITSFSPASLKPGAVLTVTGTGFVTDMATTRNQIVFDAGNGLTATVPLLEADATTLKTFVPGLAKDLQSDWYQGPVTLCVETDGQRSCSQQRLIIEAPPAVSGNPGDLMIQFLQNSNKAVLDSMSSWASAQQVSDFQTMSAQALQDLGQKIADAQAGKPQATTVTMDDGSTVTVLFDLPAIRKMEALLTGSQSYLNGVLQPMVESAGRLRARAIDWSTEEQLTQLKTLHKTMDDAGRALAISQLGLSGGALGACLLLPPSCLAVAAALSSEAPWFAAASLLQVAAVATIELGPNSLDSLTTAPSGNIELPLWSTQQLNVEGHFVSTIDPTTAVKEVAQLIVSRWISDALPFGVGGQYLVQKTLDPVIGVIADSLLNLGLRDRLRIQGGSARDVSLSLNTVDSSCFRGSSPSPGMSWFLDTYWMMNAFQSMAGADRCDFWALDNLMWLRQGAPTASATVRVPAEQSATCASFPDGTLVPFGSLYNVSAAIANGDRVVVGLPQQNYLNPFNVPVGYYTAQLPLPRFANERYCSPVQLAPGCTADAYVPTQSERNGNFAPFANAPLYDPRSCVVVNGAKVCSFLPAGLIPPNGIYGWRVRSAQGCGQ